MRTLLIKLLGPEVTPSEKTPKAFYSMPKILQTNN